MTSSLSGNAGKARERELSRVTIIIPTYNRSYCIGDAIECVLRQGYRDLEVLVIDDGSTDETQAVVEATRDDRVKYVWKENGGVACARNMGLDMANGEFVSFLDADDLWPDDFVDKMLGAMSRHPESGLVYGRIRYVDVDGRTELKKQRCHTTPSGWITSELFCSGFVSPVAVMIRRECLRGMRFDRSLPTAEDSDFFLRLSLITQAVYVPDVEVLVRATQDSLSRGCGPNCNRILSLERFCRVAGKRVVPAVRMRRKLSHACRQVAEQYRQQMAREAAVFLYAKGIKYWPVDLRLYWGLARSLLLSRGSDPQPDWVMTADLPDIELGCNHPGASEVMRTQ